MKSLATFVFLLRSIFWGGLFGLAFLFFTPNSKLPFNWQVAQEMFDYYQAEKAANEKHKDQVHLTVESFSLASAVEKASPSVVSINAFRGRLRRDERLAPNQQVLDTAVGIGSGVILSSEGHIVTNYHVVKEAVGISVNLSDGRKKVASIVGYDQETDLAVLKVDLQNLNPAELAHSQQIHPGDLVMAIGSPFGRNQSVSLGIVSAIPINRFTSRIQTDAAINEGNSGGALINTQGQVVGINQITLSSRGGGQTGINYAIPVDRVKNIVAEILEHGRVKRNWLGIKAAELPESIHRTNFPDVPYGQGIFVENVEKNSPAAIAGLKPLDYITKFKGEDITGISDFYRLFYGIEVGATVETEYYRNGEISKASIQLFEKEQD